MDDEGAFTTTEIAEYDRLAEGLSSATTRLADFTQAIALSLAEVRTAHGG